MIVTVYGGCSDGKSDDIRSFSVGGNASTHTRSGLIEGRIDAHSSDRSYVILE